METVQDLPQEPILPSEPQKITEEIPPDQEPPVLPGRNWILVAGAIVVAIFVAGLAVLVLGEKEWGRRTRQGAVPTPVPTTREGFPKDVEIKIGTPTPTPMKTGANEAIDKALEDLDKALNEVDAALQGIDSDLAEDDSSPDI